MRIAIPVAAVHHDGTEWVWLQMGVILNANALHIPLASESVQCIVTSPPYWGLRDYGTATWIGGDPTCDHSPARKNGHGSSTITGGQLTNGHAQEPYRNECAKCGAARVDNQLGLETTPEEYVSNMVAVFRECWRVLRDDGTLWLNLGDSYASGKGTCYNPGGGEKSFVQNKDRYQLDRGNVSTLRESGIKPKDLVGIPWTVALALRADGWYLRRDIIWNKPNPMPESVTDRPTSSHEYMFLLTKNARYYYDNEAIKEPSKDPEDNRGERGNRKRFPTDKISGIRGPGIYPMANRRSVWTIATQPTPFAHFATMPEKFVEPCILAGTSERGCCPSCGKPWEREIDKQFIPQEDVSAERVGYRRETEGVPGNGWKGAPRGSIASATTGWRPGCACDAGDPIPCVVFDPFAGSGTTYKVAIRYGRKFIGTELNYKYIHDIVPLRMNGIQVVMI